MANSKDFSKIELKIIENGFKNKQKLIKMSDNKFEMMLNMFLKNKLEAGITPLKTHIINWINVGSSWKRDLQIAKADKKVKIIEKAFSKTKEWLMNEVVKTPNGKIMIMNMLYAQDNDNSEKQEINIKIGEIRKVEIN